MKVEICGVVKKFGKNTVLNGVDIEAESGMCVGLSGINGSGKSTLFGILAGISSCDDGCFFYDGVDLLKDKKMLGKTVGYVPQNPPLLEELSVLDNLRLWYSNKEITKQLDKGMLDVLGVGGYLKKQVKKLSGGMKKRLSIACAVSGGPEILIMDEPTAALDLLGKKAVFEYIEFFKKSGGIVILSSHDVSEIGLCDKVYVLSGGVTREVAFDGDADKLLGCLKNDDD